MLQNATTLAFWGVDTEALEALQAKGAASGASVMTTDLGRVLVIKEVIEIMKKSP